MSKTKDRFADLKLSALSEEEKQSLINLAMKSLSGKHRAGSALCDAATTRQYLSLRLGGHQHEVFGCLLLDTRNRVIGIRELFHGTIDGAAVYPRIVVQQVLDLNAAAVIFFHNHPSGVAEPSQADEALTRRLKEALGLIDVRVLDHLVVCAGESVSFAERGLI